MKWRKYYLPVGLVLLTITFCKSGASTSEVVRSAASANRTMKVSMPQTPDFDFGSASFTKEFWIDNKRLFKKTKGVDVEFINAGAWDWVFVDADGKEVRTLRTPNEHGGWTSVDFPSLGLYRDYSIGFRNASSGTQQIKQGVVHFR